MGLHRKSREQYNNDNPVSLCNTSSDPHCPKVQMNNTKDRKKTRVCSCDFTTAEVSHGSDSEKVSGRVQVTENAVLEGIL